MANETKIRITAETAQAQAALRTFGQELTGVTGRLASLTGIAGTLGGALSVTAFAGFIKNSIDAADNLNDLAQKTGTSVEALAGLKFAADQNGTSLESVAQASKKLATSMAEHPDTFKKFGITAKDTTGALVQLADIFAAMPDGAEKSALAVKLMGKSGEEMIPFLNQGSDALRRLADEGARLNPITTEMAKQADQFNDDMARLKMQAGGLGIMFANELLPNLTDTATAMADLAKEGHGVLALWRGLAGMGKIPWDFLFPPENLKESLSSANRLKKLKSDLADIENYLKRTNGRGDGQIGKWLHGSPEEQKRQAEVLRNQIAALEKFGAQIDKKPDAPVVVKKDGRKGRALNDALRDDGKKAKDPDAEVKKFISSLQEDAAVVGLSAEAHKLYDAAKMAAANPKFADAIAREANLFFDRNAAVQQGIDATKAFEKANKDLNESNAELQRSALEAQAIIYNLDPIAKVSAEWEKLTALKEQGLLTDEQIGKSYAKTFENIGKDGSDTFKSLENAVRGWGDEFTDQMTQMVRTGKLNFSSLADSIINDLIRMQVQKNITEPLLKAGTSFLGDIFGGMFGGRIASANGNVFSGAGISAYSGSVVDKPTLFPFARGTGLMGEAGPEAILPLTRINGKLGVQAQGGGVTVNIINAPAGTQVQQRSDGNGGMTLDVIIEQIEGGIARNVSRGTGALNGALTQTFGLNRTAGALR